MADAALVRLVKAAFAAAALTTVGFSLWNGALAQTYSVLHDFCARETERCRDGKDSLSGLVRDASGNLYGTTASGGHHDRGTVFELSSTGINGSWKHKVIHRFCPHEHHCTDGAEPSRGLVIDESGNIYGTAVGGGGHNGGLVFELKANGGGAWTYQIPYYFCVRKARNGCGPTSLSYAGQAAGQPYDGASPLYGMTSHGGRGGRLGLGTAFALSPGQGSWTESILYDFGSQIGNRDGVHPDSPLLVAEPQRLFGTTPEGGNGGYGVAFELVLDAHGEWIQRILYTFCRLANCADGANPGGQLVMNPQGGIFGTTRDGGNCAPQTVCGVVYEITPSGVETVLHTFCSENACADGGGPQGGLVMDASGNLYGTTFYNGLNSGGTLFELNGNFQVLYSFCSANSCADGGSPAGPLMLDASGNIFGTTTAAGANGAGNVFELTP